MKKLAILLFSAVPFISSCAHAQEIAQQNVPSVIVNSFTSTYPNAMDVEWEINGDTYDVEFELGQVDNHIWYNLEGKVVKHKKEVRRSELPAAVSNMLKKDFATFKIDDIDLIEENGNTYYVIDLDHPKVDRILHVKPTGEIIANYVDQD